MTDTQLVTVVAEGMTRVFLATPEGIEEWAAIRGMLPAEAAAVVSFAVAPYLGSPEPVAKAAAPKALPPGKAKASRARVALPPADLGGPRYNPRNKDGHRSGRPYGYHRARLAECMLAEPGLTAQQLRDTFPDLDARTYARLKQWRDQGGPVMRVGDRWYYRGQQEAATG